MSDDNDGVYRTNICLIFNPRVVVRHFGLLDWVSDFFIDMESKVTTTGINPRVSYTAGGKFARNGSVMTIVTLKSILKRCASNEFKNREKGASGCILPYVSTKLGERPFVHEGVVILDLDRFNKEPGLQGKENLIYDKF